MIEKTIAIGIIVFYIYAILVGSFSGKTLDVAGATVLISIFGLILIFLKNKIIIQNNQNKNIIYIYRFFCWITLLFPVIYILLGTLNIINIPYSSM
jgi:hypothetical protein